MFSSVTLAIKTEYDALKAKDPDGNLAISGMVLTNTYNGLDWQAVLPGVYHANGTPRENNPFCEIFGAQAQFRSAQKGERGELFKLDGKLLELELGDPNIRLSGGTPTRAGDSRVLITRGGHLLLNLMPSAFGRIRSKADLADPVLASFRQAFQQAGVNDPWTLELPPGAEAGRYRLDGNYYLGITRSEVSGTERRDTAISFDRPYDIYDLLKRTSLGRSDHLEFNLDPCEVRLLALLPEAKGDFAMTLHVETNRFITATVSQSGPAAGLFRLEVLRPDGELYKPATGNHACAADAVVITVDPGLEPMPGRWRFRLTDLLDGAVTEKFIDFQPGMQ